MLYMLPYNIYYLEKRICLPNSFLVKNKLFLATSEVVSKFADPFNTIVEHYKKELNNIILFIMEIIFLFVILGLIVFIGYLTLNILAPLIKFAPSIIKFICNAIAELKGEAIDGFSLVTPVARMNHYWEHEAKTILSVFLFMFLTLIVYFITLFIIGAFFVYLPQFFVMMIVIYFVNIVLGTTTANASLIGFVCSVFVFLITSFMSNNLDIQILDVKEALKKAI